MESIDALPELSDIEMPSPVGPAVAAVQEDAPESAANVAEMAPADSLAVLSRPSAVNWSNSVTWDASPGYSSPTEVSAAPPAASGAQDPPSHQPLRDWILSDRSRPPAQAQARSVGGSQADLASYMPEGPWDSDEDALA